MVLWLFLLAALAFMSAFTGGVVAHAVVHVSTTPQAGGTLDSAAFWWLGYPIVLAMALAAAECTAACVNRYRLATGMTALDPLPIGARLSRGLCWLWPMVALVCSYFLAMHWSSTGRIDDWWVLGTAFMAIYAIPASVLAQWWALRRSR